MKPSLRVAFAVMALVGSGVAFASLNAHAQQSEVPAVKHESAFTPEDCAAFLDARVAALHAGLKLTAAQEKLWPPVEAALRAAGKNAMDRYQKFKDEPEPASLIDRLRRRGENALARGQNLEAIADAAAPLYATLSEDQKHRLPLLLHAFRPHFFHPHFAMMHESHETWGPRDEWNEHKGFAPEDGEHQAPEGR